MKEIILKNYKFAIIIIAIILTIWFFINSNIEKEKTIEILSQKSNEEILIDKIKTANTIVNNLKIVIEEEERQKDMTEKEVLCLKQQLDRLVEWLEYSLDYCNSSDNLNKFSLN